jgi:probable lipoprotein (TIGR04455 family)
VASDDEDLQQLVGVYKNQLGDPAKKYAAPLFALLKDLLEELPSPELTDDEVLEKIELGSTAAHRSPLTASR